MSGLSKKHMARRIQETQHGTLQLAVQVGSFFQMGFRARVKWFFTGRFDESLALRNAQAAEAAQKAEG